MKFKRNIYFSILTVMCVILILMVIELFWPKVIPSDFINFDYLRDFIFIVAYLVTTIIALIGFIENLSDSKIEYEVGYKSVLNYDTNSKKIIFHFPITFSNSGKSTGIVKEIDLKITNKKNSATYCYSWHTFCKDDFSNGWHPRSSIRPIAILPMNAYTDLITFNNSDDKKLIYEENGKYIMEFSILVSDINKRIIRTYNWIPNDETVKMLLKIQNYTSGTYNVDFYLSDFK